LKDFEFIVIGGGGMGSATAYHLARDGKSVLLLEQFEIGHSRGSSHGESRIIRLSYWNPIYVKLARSAYAAWSQIEEDAGCKLVWKTGGIDLGTRETISFKSRIASINSENVEHEIIDAREIRKRYPQFHVPADTVAIIQPDAGLVDADKAVATMVQNAIKFGAVVMDNTPMVSIELSDDGAIIQTESKSYTCQKLIITAGAWIGPMLSKLGISLPLAVTHEQFAFFRTSKPEFFEMGKFPVFIHLNIDPTAKNSSSVYGFPIFGREGVKVALENWPPLLTTADTRSFEVNEARLEVLKNYVQRTLPDAYGEVLHAKTCLYTSTPDDHFIIDKLPSFPHVVIGSICAGHGFKFASVMGRILADLAENGSTEHPIDLFSMNRFQ
jgi:monomeric sarcosine oxidase